MADFSFSASPPNTASRPAHSSLPHATAASSDSSSSKNAVRDEDDAEAQRRETSPTSGRSHSDPSLFEPDPCSEELHRPSGDSATEPLDQKRHSLNPAASTPDGDKKHREALKKRDSHHDHVNAYTECGRHGDDWLFGGFSVMGAVKKLVEKKP